MNTSPYDHNPRYHHGLSKREHIEQITGDYWIAVYGTTYNSRRMQCYGMTVADWSTKDRIDGPRTPAYKTKLKRIMRKRARVEGKRQVEEQITENEQKAPVIHPGAECESLSGGLGGDG